MTSSNFDYHRPATLDEAIVAIQTPGATAIGSGTDLVPLLTEGLTAAARVVDLRFLPDARTITRAEDGSVRLGAGVGAGPWRVPHSIKEDVGSGGLEDDSIDALAARALYDASPLPGTAYKVVMAEAALRRAIRAIAP